MNDLITNGTEIKQRIISEINNSKQFVYLAMAYFTDRDIANAIIGAKSRNVTVDIILSSNAQNETIKQMFREANISVHAFNTGDERGMMHHKFCLIDHRITINGSYNYSYNASNNNVENIHVSDDFSMYKQFFAEFERLRYNIDNNIAVNVATPTINNIQPVQSVNPVDSFSQQLHNLVYLSTQINTEDYRKQGYEKSRESHGSTEIFKAEYNNIKEHIRIYAIDESLSSKKNILSSNINNAFENKKTEIETDKQNEIKTQKSIIDLETKHLTDKVALLKQDKSVIESGNQNTGEKGVFQLNKEIEKSKLEIWSLEQSFVVRKFANIGTISITFFLVICLFYLSIFFASALYKVFFEGNVIRASLEAGNNPGLPQIIDANAVVKIFKHQGSLFGVISALIFLFPIALTNLNIFGSHKKVVNTICFYTGLLIFDILVSGMVAINTDKIESLLHGNVSTMQFWEVVKRGEFYLIFIFGMLPLFITHYLISYVSNAYVKSRKDLVDAEKTRELQILEIEMLDLNSSKEILLNKAKDIDDTIKGINDKILNLEKEMNNNQTQIDSKYAELFKQAKFIFEDYSTKITSGKIFTDVILDSIISAYKTGFIDYLPEFYADSEVGNRIREIEQVSIVNN